LSEIYIENINNKTATFFITKVLLPVSSGFLRLEKVDFSPMFKPKKTFAGLTRIYQFF
jgi:hypothetical protein